MRRIVLLFIIYHLSLVTSLAEVKLPSFFSDNMVLQQQTECNIWGTTDQGKDIIIITSWDNEEYLAKTDKQGHFEIKVKTPKAGGPFNIAFSDGEEHI